MNKGNQLEQLNQLKIDYIEFMKQIHEWSESTIIAVLYTILMEGDYLTQEQIMFYTGFSRTVVSDTLAKLTAVTSKYPVMQTRKPGDKKKYYYCPYSFEQYISSLIVTASEVVDVNFESLSN